MAKRILTDASPFVQMLFLVFLSLFTFLVISLAGALLAVPVFHVGLTQMNEMISNLEDPVIIKLMKYLQTLQSLSLFLIPAALFLFLTREDPVAFLGLRVPPGTAVAILIIGIMIFLIPVNNVMAAWNSKMQLPDSLSGLENAMRRMEDNAEQLTRAFLKMDSFGTYMINLTIIAVLPAFGEELMFRGTIQPLFIRWTRNPHAGIWITGFLFSFFHFQFFGLLPRWILGVVFGYLFYWSKTLWLPVLAHFINNGLAVTVYYMYGPQIVEEKVDTIGTSDTRIFAAISVIIVSGLLYLLYRELSPQKRQAG